MNGPLVVEAILNYQNLKLNHKNNETSKEHIPSTC